MTNYLLSLLPWFISLVVVTAILLLREHQNAVIQKGLIDRLLVSQGHNPLPDIEPLADLTGETRKADIAEKIEEAVSKIKRMKHNPSAIRFNIPGMPRAGMGEIKRG